MRPGAPRLRWSVVALAASILLNLVFVGTAVVMRCCRPPTTPGAAPSSHPGGGLDGRLLEELALQPEQLDRISARRASTAARIAEARRRSSEARSRLWSLAAAGPDRQAELAGELDGIAAAQRQVQEQVLEYLLWVRSQLSPLQQESFDRTVARRMCRCPTCDGGCLDGCPHATGAVGAHPPGSCGASSTGSGPGAEQQMAPSCGASRPDAAGPACGCAESPGP